MTGQAISPSSHGFAWAKAVEFDKFESAVRDVLSKYSTFAQLLARSVDQVRERDRERQKEREREIESERERERERDRDREKERETEKKREKKRERERERERGRERGKEREISMSILYKL